jgi:hypothetical protein
MAEAGRGGGRIGLSALKKLDRRRPGDGVGGMFERVSIVLSDKDGLGFRLTFCIVVSRDDGGLGGSPSIGGGRVSPSPRTRPAWTLSTEGDSPSFLNGFSTSAAVFRVPARLGKRLPSLWTSDGVSAFQGEAQVFVPPLWFNRFSSDPKISSDLTPLGGWFRDPRGTGSLDRRGMLGAGLGFWSMVALNSHAAHEDANGSRQLCCQFAAGRPFQEQRPLL